MPDSDHLSVKRSALNVERSALASVDAENPWPGLASFTEELRGFFFGREKETEELVRLVRRNTLTVLFGQSGLGKSSLLQAGAFPLLREADFLPLYLRLDHDAAAPALAEQIKTALVDAFKSAGADAPAPRADESLWEYFHRKDIDIWSAKNRLLTPILAFDQFEEIFTLGRADEARRERGRAFLAELADLVENRPPEALRVKFDAGTLDPANYNFDKPSCQVILSLREDFLPDLEGLKHEMRSIVTNRMRVKRLNGTQALEIVSKPAPHLLAEGVAERIVEFVAGARGGSAERLAELEVEPALLSVICRELNERRRALGQTQITADLVSGNRREILTDFYERSVNDLPEAMRAFVEDHLLTKSGFRDNLALETALEFPGVTRPLLDTLVSRRLLRIEDRLGVQRVELTHDVLAEVIRASRDSRQQRMALEQTRAAERRTRRRLWLARTIAATFLVLLVGASWGAWRAVQGRRLEAQLASRTDVVLASRLLEEGATAEGLAYLVRAASKDPQNSLLGPRLISTLVGHGFHLPDGAPIAFPSPVMHARLSADGRRIFAQGEDRVLRVIALDTWRIEREFRFESPVKPYGWAVAAKNDRILAVELENGTLLVCDASTGQPRLPPIPRPNASEGGWTFGLVLNLSADGRWLATGDKHSVWVWDTESGTLVATLPHSKHNRWGGFAFAPDGRSIVTTTSSGVQLRSLPEGSPLGKIMGEPTSGAFQDALFSPDGTKLLVASSRKVQLYDVASGAVVGASVPHPSSGEHAVFTPDGRRFVLGSFGLDALVIDAGTGQPVFPPLRHTGAVYDPQISRDGKTLLTASTDGMARVWDLETGGLVGEPTFQENQYMPTILLPDGITMVVFSERGPAYRLRVRRSVAAPLVFPRPTNLVALDGFLNEPPARLLWFMRNRALAIDVASGQEVAGGFTYPAPLSDPTPRLSGLPKAQRIADGQTLFARVGTNTWRAWTLGKRGVVRDVSLENIPSGTPDFVLSSNGDRVAISSASDSKDFSLWDTRTGRIAGTVFHDRGISSSAIHGAPKRFSPDGQRIMFRTADDVVRIWDLGAGKELFTLQIGGRSKVLGRYEFSPDGSRIVTEDIWGNVQTWDAATGRLIASGLGHPDAVIELVFSPDGKYFASVSIYGTVQVWTVADGTPVGAKLVHKGEARSASFSPDSARIVTSSGDGTARVWDVRTGQPLTEPMRHGQDTVDKVSFSPDGRFITTETTTGSRATRVWSVPPSSGGAPVPSWLLQLATICAGRRLTDEGKFVSAVAELAKIGDIRRELAALPDHAPYVEWGRWFLSDSSTRSLAPGFTITPAEAEKLAKEMAAAPAPAAPSP